MADGERVPNQMINEILKTSKDNYNIATATEKACVIPVIKTVARRGNDTKENPLRYVTRYWSLNGELLAEKEEAFN